MRVAQISHHYLPHIGGIEAYVRRLAVSLDENGVFTEVLTTDYRTPENHRKAEARYFRTSFAFMGNPFSLDFLKHVKNHEYDVLHVHNVWFLPCLVAVFFRKNARVVTTMHGVYPDRSGVGLKFLLNVFKPLARYILGKSSMVITLSAIEKEKLQRIFRVPPRKITVIPNGIEIEPCLACDKEKTILFTGRIVADKNPDLLLRAVALLDCKLRDYPVVFAGPVSVAYKARLRLLAKTLGIENEIRYQPELDPSIEQQKNKLLNLYRQAGVFVSLGSWEGMPTRLMEAMLFKVPVIAYASGGTRELIDHGRNGLVIDRLDETQLAEKIKCILLDQDLSKRLGESARKVIVKKFDWDRLVPGIIEVYRA